MHNTNTVFKDLNGFPYKMHVFNEMQFVSHYYTVVSCEPVFRHSIYKNSEKNSAVYLSGAFFVFLHDTQFGFPDYIVRFFQMLKGS